MKKQNVLRAVFSLLAVLTVAGAVFLAQKNARALSDDEALAPLVKQEFFFMGGGRLGVQLEEVTAENMSRYRLNEEAGAIIKSVEKDSPAEKAGLQENDVIVSYAGAPIFSVAQLSRMVRETPVDRVISLGVLRNGNQQTVQVKIGGHHADHFKLSGDFGKITQEAAKAAGKATELLARHGNFMGRPRLGVNLESLTDQMSTYFGVKAGVLITSVSENSPAAKAGLRAGDVITAVDNKEIKEPFEVIRIISDKTEGGTVAMTIVRDKRSMSVNVTLEKVERPDRPKVRTIRTQGIKI